MTPARCAALAAVCAAALMGCAQPEPIPETPPPAPAAPAGPPVAPVRAVEETHFGTTVSDPYRWMEATDAAEFQGWIKAQDEYTRMLLARLPGRDALAKRIESLSDSGTIVYKVQQAGSRYFYLKQGPGDQDFKLYARDGLTGPERLLVDPVSMSSKDQHYSISYYYASRDGAFAAYGISPGGSEHANLRIVDAAIGKPLAEDIDRTDFGVVSWLADNKSFVYHRLQKLPESAPPTERYAKSRVYLHRVGEHADGEGDVPEFGFGMSPAVPVDANEVSFVLTSAASPYALGIVQKFVKNEVTIYAAPVKSLNGAKTPWRKVVSEDDDVTAYDVHDEFIYLMTHHGASRFKVLRTRLDHPDFAHALEIVPASEAVITGLGTAKDALYVQQLDGGLARLTRVPFGKGLKAAGVPLPYDGAFGEFVTDAQLPGALVKMTSWTEPQLWYAYDPKSGKFTDTGLRPRSPVDYSAITSEEVKVPSHDGVLVPLSIIHRKDLRKDGNNPVLLSGYGAYGIRQDPGFNPVLLAWLERGGVYAVAHVRGGGEYGEDWHLAGQKLNKMNTVKDFIACGQYLVEQKWTMPAMLGAEGGSAGGITVGGAMTQKPNLFAAVIDDVGVSDNLRIEFTANGPPNIPEFGSVTTEEGFQGLYAMSSYHHVKDATPYPAVLLTTGIHDPRVDSWQAAKMAARLQAASVSGRPVLLRVDYDAGHGIGSTKAQANELQADEWAFLLWQFGDPAFQPKH
jgi:prolyl oligopeptidase